MPRWEPDAADRLAAAALDLYAEQGFEGTTVAEIAARAGLTERTFFRHFADKREVLFGRSPELQALMVASVADAPDSLAPLESVGRALEASAQLLETRRDFAVQRHAVITASAELLERELVKLATLARAVADVLRARGVPDPAATLTADAGIAVFRVGFERWVQPGNERGLAELMRASLDDLRAVTAAS